MKYLTLAFIIACLITLGTFIAVIYGFSADDARMFSAESALLETKTACMLFIGSVIALIYSFVKRMSSKIWVMYALGMFLAGAREFDLHKEWTSMSVLKLRFYSSDAVPLFEKMIGAVVIAAILGLIVYVFYKRSALWNALKDKNRLVTVGFVAFFTMGVAKFFDGIFRYLPFLKDTSFIDKQAHIGLLEESMEYIGAAILCVIPAIMMWRYLRDRQSSKT